jgi:hypothetical protein
MLYAAETVRSYLYITWLIIFAAGFSKVPATQGLEKENRTDGER